MRLVRETRVSLRWQSRIGFIHHEEIGGHYLVPWLLSSSPELEKLVGKWNVYDGVDVVDDEAVKKVAISSCIFQSAWHGHS